MLPRLSNVPQLNNVVSDYLSELQKQHFEGDIASNYADRLSLATDNSVYQQLPQAILFPKSVADVVRITKLANKEKYLHLTFTPRGGGTGTNGQSINNNIIVDLSRHMTGILELNIEERWVRVQAGVVKDQLNQFLKPHGLFFAPELSTSNRATLGGMINTDASGQGSLQYGKTSDHVLALRSVLMNGEILDWRKLLLFVGIPFGIQKMFLLVVPRNVGTGEMLGLVVLKLMVGSLIGIGVLAWRLLAVAGILLKNGISRIIWIIKRLKEMVIKNERKATEKIVL